MNLQLSSSRIKEPIRHVALSVFFRNGRDNLISTFLTNGFGINSMPISKAAFEPIKSHVQMCSRSIAIDLFDNMKYVLFIKTII